MLGGPVYAPLRFLIVDDDELIRAVMRIALTRAGHEVSDAAGPARALELALAVRPDVVVCDYRLARTSGVGLLAEIAARAEEASGWAPALVLVSGEERRGSWPYPSLRKPFRIEELLELASRMLGDRARALP